MREEHVVDRTVGVIQNLQEVTPKKKREHIFFEGLHSCAFLCNLAWERSNVNQKQIRNYECNCQIQH